MIKSSFIKGKNLDDVYFQLLSEVMKEGRVNPIDTGSFAGAKRLEFDFVAGQIEYPTTRPLAPIFPEGVPPVTTDDEIEKYFVNYIMDGTLTDNEHYKYATWISGGSYKIPMFSIPSKAENSYEGRAKYGVWTVVPNQVEWIIKHYKEKGYGNNHCYITVGYPESNLAYDMPYKNEAERGTSPCLRGIDTKIIEDNGKHYLSLHVYFRSWDLFAGFPENMGGMVMLMEYMANELEVEVGSLYFSAMKLHCYDFQLDAVKARLHIE